MPASQSTPPRSGRPPSPAQQRPGPQGTRPEGDADARADAMKWVRIFGLVLLLAMGLGLFALPWPWPLASGALCLVALALGVVALVKVRVAKVRGAMTPVLITGLVLAAVMGLATLSQAFLWREYSAYTDCLGSAITQQAKDACRSQLERDLDERLGNMQQILGALRA